LLLFAATCVAHLAVESYSGIAVYLLRIAFCCAMAGFGGASMTFVSARCPPKRLAELIGMLGTAGFLGYVLGSLLGDVLFGSVAVDRPQVELMFILAGLLGLIAIPFAWFATRKEVQLPQQPSPGLSLLGLLRRHNPGVVLVVGVAMGAGLGLPSTFLRTYAAELGIPRIGLFFLVYALAALFVRVITRRWIERFGTRPIILLGMAILAASLMFFLPVHAEWHLILPAIGFGCSHAILFPAVVAVGSYSFPVRNRGLASVLILAMWDLGILVISPVAGGVLRYSKMIDLPPYPMMFLATSSLMVLVGIWYAVASRSVKPAG
jgi:MFS family permease